MQLSIHVYQVTPFMQKALHSRGQCPKKIAHLHLCLPCWIQPTFSLLQLQMLTTHNEGEVLLAQ